MGIETITRSSSLCWICGWKFYFITSFFEKTNKTPRREIELAKMELEDYKEGEKKMNSAQDHEWGRVRNELLSKEEIIESDLRVALVGEIIKAREAMGISQKKLEELSGVKQPIIARMEKGKTSPQLDTILKILAPLGKTLYVGDLKK